MRAQLVRTAVLEIYEEVRREGARADQALQRVLRREKQLRSVERRAVSDAVYGLLRLQGRVDHLLGRALQTRKQQLSGLASPTQHLLRYAAYLVVGDQQSAESAVGLAGPEVTPYRWVLELVAKPAELGGPVSGDPVDALAAETSLPRWLAKLWGDQLGADETRKLAEALNQRAPLTVRVNELKNDRAQLLTTLRAEGARVEPTKLSPWGVEFVGRTNVFALKAFKAGLFEVQDEGSQLIALACGARPGMLVVDACAGAGGKALALAGEMHNKGRLIACDRDGRRLDEMRPRARRDGVHNWEARAVPESSDARIADLLGQADVVLIDAPCSGLGALRRNPDARWRLNQEEVDSFPPRQKQILGRYSALVKPGGRLVYATCSINRQENEEVREAFLAQHPGFAPIPPAKLLGAELAEKVKARAHDVQLLPHQHGTDGFYIAGMVRSS